MRLRNSILVFLPALCLVLPSCGRGTKTAEGTSGIREFTLVKVPSVYDNPSDVLQYTSEHFWDNFLKSGYATDSLRIAGVPALQVQQAVADYMTILDGIPVADAQRSIRSTFRKAETVQAADSASAFLGAFTELLSKYLYGPDSPYRSEDLYLPLVEELCESKYTSPDALPGYIFQRDKCRLNRYMEKVPDIRFTDSGMHRGHLYGIDAQYTLILFSNPGCNACRDVIDLLSEAEPIQERLESGSLAVISIYIDEDMDAWWRYVPLYPGNWTVAYNHDLTVRDDGDWYIRAIPSLYLLDRDKRVLLKDAPGGKVINYLYRNN